MPSRNSMQHGYGWVPFISWCLLRWFSKAMPFLIWLSQDVEINELTLPLQYSFYVFRALIYPWLIKGGKPTPIFLAFLAFTFCTLNGYMQARYLTKYAYYEKSWLSNPCFLCGVVMFFIGMVINIHSDHILRNLRKPGETGYKIPRGMLSFHFKISD